MNFRQVGKDSTVKVKALNETILRLTKSNEQLQAENRGLKEDLRNALDDTKDRSPNSKYRFHYYFNCLSPIQLNLNKLISVSYDLSKIDSGMRNSVDPDQSAPIRSSLIRLYTVQTLFFR